MATLDVKQSGGSYSTLASALSSANAGDTISIEGSWTANDTSAATIADDNLTIQTDSSSKHPGFWDESTSQHYRLNVSSNNHALLLDGAYTVTIDGLAIRYSGSWNSAECFRCIPGTSDTATIKNSLIQQDGSHVYSDGIYTGFNESIGTITVEQCILSNAPRAQIHSQNSYSSSYNGTINVNSCSIESGAGANGILASGVPGNVDLNVHNSLVMDGFGGDNYWGTTSAGYSIETSTTMGGFDNSSNNLLSRDSTDSDSPGTGDWVVFEDITSGDPMDLRIKDNAENDAQDYHATATIYGLTIPSTDIVGTSRPQGTNYDVGAFEIQVAGAGDSIAPLYRKIRSRNLPHWRM